MYNKCMRLAPWSSTDASSEEDKPLLHSHEVSASTRSGLLTNLVSQDTYNIMSCVWICHYIWAIPLKVRYIMTATDYFIKFQYVLTNILYIANYKFILGSCFIVLFVQKVRNKCNNRNCSKRIYYNTFTILYWKKVIGQFKGCFKMHRSQDIKNYRNITRH